MHVDDPPTLYVPTPHCIADDDVDPFTHAYPASHGPLQLLVVSPTVEPYRPPSHSPLQLDDVRPHDDPYRPAAHDEHTDDPAVEY